jgi:hypothetical protein
VGAVRLTLTEPGDGLDRLLGRARRVFNGGEAPRYDHGADTEWERHMHEQIGAPWPCPAASEFAALWPQVLAELAGEGLAVGRGAYGGWDDADQGFARAVWCLARHLHARKAIETGVARGITSRILLEAMRGGDGHLWSIDLPALDAAIHTEIATAVPAALRDGWTYLSGTSRRCLPPLLAQLGEIDLFVHDSSHTDRNLRFELQSAWRGLARGAIVADDIDRNRAFVRFARAQAGARWLVAGADDGQAQFGVLLKGL